VERHFRRLRDQLNAGSLSIQALAEQEDLRLATDRIAYWSHWITPRGEPRRYDTRFFATRAPERQIATHDDWELTDSAWVAPREAIERARRREWQIIFPTVMNLEALARHPSAEAAVDWAGRQSLPLPANLPRVLRGRVLLPGDPDYELGDPDISRLDRAARDRAFLP
jgi:hypothetical protein